MGIFRLSGGIWENPDCSLSNGPAGLRLGKLDQEWDTWWFYTSFTLCNWIVCSSAGYAQPAKASIVQPWAEPHRDQYSFVSLPPPLRLPPRMGANLTALATVPMSKALGEVSTTDALWERGRNINRTASAHLSTSSSGQELPFSSVFACPSRTTGLAARPLVIERPCNNCPGSYCC